MIILTGKIVPGIGMATEFFKQQSPFFVDGGIEKEVFSNGSINVDISPKKWKITNPDFEFKNILWDQDFGLEDFNFIMLKLKFQGKIYPGYIYNPTRTKNPNTMIEIVAKRIEGIEYGKEIELLIPEDKIRFLD